VAPARNFLPAGFVSGDDYTAIDFHVAIAGASGYATATSITTA
jgi:hypothetical protein